jgi:transposase
MQHDFITIDFRQVNSMADSESLPKIIDNLHQQTSSQKRAVVVIDAGIPTEDNLAIIQQKGYDYVCVSRSKIKDYSIKEEAGTTHIVTKNKQVISLQKVNTKQTSDYVLRVKSLGKEVKKRTM